MWDSKGVSLHSPSAAAKQFFFYQFQVSEERKPQIDRKEWRGSRNRKHAVVWRCFLGCLNLPWFAIRVKSRFERAVSSALRYRGFEEFLPMFSSRRQWSDRIKFLQVPLFPGYLFCRFAPEDRSPILTIPGVVLVVGVGKIPVAVNPVEIEAIRLAVNSGRDVKPWNHFCVGRKVRIAEGPLCGVEGVLQRFKGGCHLVLGIELLRRWVAVEVHESWVVPCEPMIPSVNASEMLQVSNGAHGKAAHETFFVPNLDNQNVVEQQFTSAR